MEVHDDDRDSDAADPAVEETIKRTVQPYFVLDGNICALLATKDHVNIFIYDPIVPDPHGIVTAGHGNKTARTVAIGRAEKVNEKALTAIALVFAIFQLNPAPFCLLDEVDAPLDDANTERYAKLVTEMSKATQFLFISHNRIAMEMAEQLIGVTMQEQGVSRIVTVDMPGAMRLAEAA